VHTSARPKERQGPAAYRLSACLCLGQHLVPKRGARVHLGADGAPTCRGVYKQGCAQAGDGDIVLWQCGQFVDHLCCGKLLRHLKRLLVRTCLHVGASWVAGRTQASKAASTSVLNQPPPTASPSSMRARSGARQCNGASKARTRTCTLEPGYTCLRAYVFLCVCASVGV